MLNDDEIYDLLQKYNNLPKFQIYEVSQETTITTVYILFKKHNKKIKKQQVCRVVSLYDGFSYFSAIFLSQFSQILP